MPAAIDMTGLLFGRLTAIAPLSRGRWLFACSCGAEKPLNSASVRDGTTRSCGCLRRETTAAARAIDLAGFVTGRLTVESQLLDRDKNGCVQWSCACSCGKRTTGITRILKAGLKRSCGCLQRESIAAIGASSKQTNPVSRTPEYRKAQRQKRRKSELYNIAERMSRMLAWALARHNAVKRGRTFDLLGFTPAQLRDHLERQFKEGMSWGNRGDWEIDHITPISTATSEADVLRLNQLSNLRPLWATDNNRKNNRRQFLL